MKITKKFIPLRNEEVMAMTRGHWVTMVPQLSWGVVLLLMWGMYPLALDKLHVISLSYHSWGSWLTVDPSITALLVILIAVAANGLSAWIRYTTTQYIVTNIRIFCRTGWIRGHSDETPLTSIESVHCDQGYLGSMIGYGSVVVIGRGDTPQALRKIPDPKLIRNQINQLRYDKYQSTHAQSE